MSHLRTQFSINVKVNAPVSKVQTKNQPMQPTAKSYYYILSMHYLQNCYSYHVLKNAFLKLILFKLIL
jgi:hypothetical protein